MSALKEKVNSLQRRVWLSNLAVSGKSETTEHLPFLSRRNPTEIIKAMFSFQHKYDQQELSPKVPAKSCTLPQLLLDAASSPNQNVYKNDVRDAYF